MTSTSFSSGSPHPCPRRPPTLTSTRVLKRVIYVGTARCFEDFILICAVWCVTWRRLVENWGAAGQIILSKELDGITVEIPAVSRNFYVDGHVPVPH
jgi:hypothetical protein